MIRDLVADEVEALHAEFERWFHGTADSLDRVERALAHDFLFVAPSGAVVPRAELLAGLLDARGARPLSIRIENVEVKWQRGDVVAATYEEWQSQAGHTIGRQSSVVMERDDAAPGKFRWLSVHETWLVPPPA